MQNPKRVPALIQPKKDQDGTSKRRPVPTRGRDQGRGYVGSDYDELSKHGATRK